MLACINFALAVFALSVGGHALAWIIRDRAERDGRVGSFELAARVHAANASGLLIIAIAGSMSIMAMPLVAFLWAGMALFCGALYAHGLFGITWAMPGTVFGSGLMVIGWVLAGAALSSAWP
jgi:uncharacterized membrane protein YgdD (TMEM256/DUF423 family)